VDALADLSAGADEGVGVDHGAFVDEGSDVDVGGRHHDDAGGEVGAGAYGAAAGDDADVVFGAEAADGVGGFVDEGEVLRGRRELAGFARLATHLGEGAEAEAE
jgi:hypothetical protein